MSESPVSRDGTPRDESLIERAAQIYDFDSQFRVRRGASLLSTRTTADSDPPPPPQPESHTFLDDAPPPPPGAETLSREAALTLAAIPLELRDFGTTDDEDDVSALSEPSDVISIDRALLAAKGMLVPGAPVGALAEEFRLVKRQLLLNARAIALGTPERRARTILVGSGKPGEGKTFCAINLAISLAAERDVEVLLVDADFAKPDVLASLGLSDSTGLLDIIDDPALDPESFRCSRRARGATPIPNCSPARAPPRCSTGCSRPIRAGSSCSIRRLHWRRRRHRCWRCSSRR